MFKRGRHKNLTIFIISQDYYEHPKRTIGADEISITYSNQTVSETYKIFIERKQAWI